MPASAACVQSPCQYFSNSKVFYHECVGALNPEMASSMDCVKLERAGYKRKHVHQNFIERIHALRLSCVLWLFLPLSLARFCVCVCFC